MSETSYLKWARKCEPGKEHVSFKNFVRKFDFTDKKAAHNAYSSLIESHLIRKSRRDHLRRAYSTFWARNEEMFWAHRTLDIAERALRINTAVVAKRSAIAAQNAGLREATAAFERYFSGLKSNEKTEISDTVRRECAEPIVENDTEDGDPLDLTDEGNCFGADELYEEYLRSMYLFDSHGSLQHSIMAIRIILFS